ncbi:MAG: hypothetical protein HC933_10855 [Pleurocapsa sp. SU_196_0]|nr:hypothetical protein [Pleurocapsa sp. SU_196_0]
MEQIWYVVAYLKSLAADQDLTPKAGREKYYDKGVLQPGQTERKYEGAPKAGGGH